MPEESSGVERELSGGTDHPPAFPESQLALPTSFGAIYLGESFPAYLSMTNDSAREAARDVVIKAELQTSTQRFILIDTADSPTPVMPPQALTEYLIKHEVKELGVHVLVCSVQYTAKQLGTTGQSRDERRSFRKFYKFQVLNPLAVKTKVNSRLDARVFLEVQVQNITQDPMCLEKLNLDPAGPFAVRDLNIRLDPAEAVQGPQSQASESESGSESEEDSSPDSPVAHIFGDTNFLLPGDVRQYLYLLHPKDDLSVANALTSNALGKLDIVWRFSFGETGRLQTSQLTRRVPVADAIQVITRRVQDDVQVERPFTIDLRIFNRTDAPMKLQLSAVKAKMGAVLMRGQASRALGEVRPQGDVECTLEFLPLAPGLHTVSGVRVSDYISGESRDIEVAEVFVTMGPTLTGEGDEDGWGGEGGMMMGQSRSGLGGELDDTRLMGHMPSGSGDHHGWSQVGGGFTKRRLTLTRPTLSDPEDEV
ncbi:hypothetical protein BJ684DRAFT_7545 [Piptocephalis cylindrospora]|uniref:Uncharacterized protein n=1 Tax=Piptocephalis cylindrospora TaxID=1907219 RepID=A0A4P9Y7I9_9FUNG|nr:hypothetical protein BJ684DRAFT_7545 [Piptocephalis cylindrospora]|eukprot:RKP15096.1 hypothetical protein BJ684DRAFT_7545 [Piptocephalis cylindrospora]